MLKRNFPPNKGLWNGVGGKIEAEETPLESVRREVFEETGIELPSVDLLGEVTWITEEASSGMYVYSAELPENWVLETPRVMDEGILDWKAAESVLDQNNPEIVDNIPIFLPKMLEDPMRYTYCFTYRDNRMVDCQEALVATQAIRCYSAGM